jgi:hypothetical protein
VVLGVPVEGVVVLGEPVEGVVVPGELVLVEGVVVLEVPELTADCPLPPQALIESPIAAAVNHLRIIEMLMECVSADDDSSPDLSLQINGLEVTVAPRRRPSSATSGRG